MIKKKDISKEDIDTWQSYIKNPSDIIDKDQENIAIDGNIKKGRFKYDLHGHTLFEANKKVKEIIKSCSEKNCREILLITGKGLHSDQEDVYKSSDLSKLRFSVPEFINSDPEISKLILSIVNPPQKEGGEGALLIKLRKL